MSERTARRVRAVLAFGAATLLLLLLQGAASGLPPGAPRIGMVCAPGSVSGSTHTFNLVANTGTIQTPDGNTVFAWSYANADAPDNSDFQFPGPTLCATEGQTVVVHLHNTLPERASIVFPGQQGVTASGGLSGLFTTEAASGGDVTYSFAAGQPGTYLYESGSDVSKQVEMGLYGALVVRPAIGANYAYDATTQFDPQREFLLVLGELDPDLHHAVETGGEYDIAKLHNRYFTINGREFPDTLQDNGTSLLPTQPYGALVRIQPYDAATNPHPTLIRVINAGAQSHPFHPHGDHLRQIAQDGRLLESPGGGSASSERFGETIGSGQTQDYLLSWRDQDGWNPNTNPLPVAQPNYRNLVFKDGNTFYSGNPYLGFIGTLPTGTTTQNICGEWYFPWHSHALNEFANFDEPFGGMATMLRVDPLGGCFTFPTTTKITVGTLNSGAVANLAAANETPTAKYYKVNSTTTGTRTTDWYGQFQGVIAGATGLKVTYEGNASAGSATQTLYVWRWTSPAGWVQIGSPAAVGPTDVTVGPVAACGTGPLPSCSQVVGTGANKGRVRVRVLSTQAATNFVTGGDLMKLVYDAP